MSSNAYLKLPPTCNALQWELAEMRILGDSRIYSEKFKSVFCAFKKIS